MRDYAFGPFVLDASRGILLRDGAPISIGQRALALLQALLEADGSAVPKAALMDAAWPGIVVEEVNLSVQITALRKALGARDDGQDWIVTVPRVGYRLPLATARAAPASRSGPARIVVLPFANLSDRPGKDYFADGIAEDIITALSRFRTIAVVSRGASFSYKGRAPEPRQVAAELGVDYVLSGSVRHAADRVRVGVELIDGQSGRNLWAERFDAPLVDVFDVQDRITERVIGLVEPRVRKAEIEHARGKRPESLDGYDLYLQALPHFWGVAPDGFATAIALMERALALDPEFPMLVAFAAWAHEKRDTLGLPPLHADPRRGLSLARHGIRISADDPQALVICSTIIMIMGERSETAACLDAAARAYAANPNNLLVCNLLGNLFTGCGGNLDAALAAYERVLALSPGAPEVYEALSGIGTVHYYLGNYSEAVVWLRRSLSTGTEWQPTYWHLVAALVGLGRMEEARQAVAQLLLLAPHSTVAQLRTITSRGGFSRYEAHLLEPLRRAGLPAG